MSSAPTLEETLTRYLLGDLPAEEQDRIEQGLLSDQDLYDDLLATTDDLIHAYLAGALSPEDRRLFESHFLASEGRRHRLTFIRELLAAVDRVSLDAPSPKARRASHWRTWAVAASLILAAVVALILAWQARSTRDELADRPPSPRLSPPAGLPSLSPGPPDPEIRTVRLPRTPPTSAIEVALAPGTRSLQLEIPLDDERSPTFQARVRTPGGSEAWRQEGLAPDRSGASLRLTVPTTALSGDDYVVLVEGEPVRDLTGRPPPRWQYRLRLMRPR